MRLKSALLGLAAVLLAGLVSQVDLGRLEPSLEARPPETMQIFILAGQSNMSGRGDLVNLPAGFPSHANRLFVYSNAGRWQRAVEPVDNPLDQVDRVSLDRLVGVGPGLAMADRLAAAWPGVSIGLVPCARAGSRIDQWAPHPSRSTLYGSCLARAREAAQAGPIRAVIWYQGESDTHSQAEVMAWPEKFAALTRAWRRDLNQPNLPVVFTQLGPLGPRFRNRRPAWDQMRNLQAALHIPGAVMVTAGDLKVFDGIHLDTASQLRLGRRYAEALLKILANPK